MRQIGVSSKGKKGGGWIWRGNSKDKWIYFTNKKIKSQKINEQWGEKDENLRACPEPVRTTLPSVGLILAPHIRSENTIDPSCISVSGPTGEWIDKFRPRKKAERTPYHRAAK